jgi:hypothetical protein
MLALLTMSVPAFPAAVHAEPSCSEGFCQDCLDGTVWIRAGDQIYKDGHWLVCDGDTGKLVEAVVGPRTVMPIAIGVH